MMRAVLTVPALVLLCGVANAEGDAPASTGGVYACAELGDDMARLACYDAAVGRLKAAEAAGEVTTISRAEVEEVQKDAFGFSLPSLPKLAMPKFGNGDKKGDGVIDSVTTEIAEIKAIKSRGITVTLTNGQVWRQTDTRKVQYSKRKEVNVAEIKTAAFGSYMMKIDGGTAFRVERVK